MVRNEQIFLPKTAKTLKFIPGPGIARYKPRHIIPDILKATFGRQKDLQILQTQWCVIHTVYDRPVIPEVFGEIVFHSVP